MKQGGNITTPSPSQQDDVRNNLNLLLNKGEGTNIERQIIEKYSRSSSFIVRYWRKFCYTGKSAEVEKETASLIHNFLKWRQEFKKEVENIERKDSAEAKLYLSGQDIDGFDIVNFDVKDFKVAQDGQNM